METVEQLEPVTGAWGFYWLQDAHTFLRVPPLQGREPSNLPLVMVAYLLSVNSRQAENAAILAGIPGAVIAKAVSKG